MRILQMIDSLDIGGAEMMAVNISNVLAQNGHTVILCVSRSNGPLVKKVSPEVAIVFLNKKRTFHLRSYINLLQIVKKSRIETIHAHSSSIYWASILKLLFPRLKLIWHDHLGARNTGLDKREKLLRLISSLIDSVICVNNEQKLWASNRLRLPVGRIFLIENFPSLDLSGKQVKKENDKFICLMLANLRYPKDHLTIVLALAKLVKEKREGPIHFRFVGEYKNDDYFSILKKEIEKNDLWRYIDITGRIDSPEEELLKADLGLLISTSEGLPVSLLEYGLAGLPVICSDVGHCREIVKDGLLGQIIPPKSPENLAEALYRSMLDRQRTKNFGIALQMHVQSNYSSRKFLTIYGNVLNQLSNKKHNKSCLLT